MRTRKKRPISPPQNELMMAVLTARSPSPFMAMGCPSIKVAAAAGVPGIFKKIAEIDPPVIPAWYKPRSIPIVASVDILKVRGSRMIIPRLTVRPGNTPTISPKTTPAKEARRF